MELFLLIEEFYTFPQVFGKMAPPISNALEKAVHSRKNHFKRLVFRLRLNSNFLRLMEVLRR